MPGPMGMGPLGPRDPKVAHYFGGPRTVGPCEGCRRTCPTFACGFVVETLPSGTVVMSDRRICSTCLRNVVGRSDLADDEGNARGTFDQRFGRNAPPPDDATPA